MSSIEVMLFYIDNIYWHHWLIYMTRLAGTGPSQLALLLYIIMSWRCRQPCWSESYHQVFDLVCPKFPDSHLKQFAVVLSYILFVFADQFYRERISYFRLFCIIWFTWNDITCHVTRHIISHFFSLKACLHSGVWEDMWRHMLSQHVTVTKGSSGQQLSYCGSRRW
jgi:hypothetical protein